MPIMSTNIIAFLLLNKFRDGCTLDKLVEAFDLMRQELEFGDKNIAFCGESVDIIKHAVGRRISDEMIGIREKMNKRINVLTSNL